MRPTALTYALPSFFWLYSMSSISFSFRSSRTAYNIFDGSKEFRLLETYRPKEILLHWNSTEFRCWKDVGIMNGLRLMSAVQWILQILCLQLKWLIDDRWLFVMTFDLPWAIVDFTISASFCDHRINSALSKATGRLPIDNERVLTRAMFFLAQRVTWKGTASGS